MGKGVTFDAGGISIKPSAGMGDMRADMGKSPSPSSKPPLDCFGVSYYLIYDSVGLQSFLRTNYRFFL